MSPTFGHFTASLAPSKVGINSEFVELLNQRELHMTRVYITEVKRSAIGRHFGAYPISVR